MKDKINYLIQKINNQRMSMNYNDIGFGLDIYSRNLKYHYDEAYSLWGLGILNLHKMGHEIADPNLLDHILNYFYNNKRYDGSFGLPWDWQGQNKDEGYLITSSFVGLFLQNYNSLFSHNKVEILLTQIEDYILSLKKIRNGHIYLSYSKYMNEDVLNAYAVAMLFLIIRDYKKNLDIVNHLLDSIMDGQNKDGGFIYILYPKGNIDLPDNYHQCFILNSLLKINDFLNDNIPIKRKIIEITTKGIDYFMANFFDDDLYLRKYAKKPLFGENSFNYRKTKAIWAIGRIKRKLLNQPLSRSKPSFYDFGQTLVLLSTDIDKYSDHIQSVINQAENFLEHRNEADFYIRDFGHFFYGLTEVLVKLK